MPGTAQWAAIEYDGEWYRQYRYLSGVDEAKKCLERDALLFTLAGNEVRPGTLLDVGTATGRYPVLLGRRGWRGMGIDVSEDALSIARAEVAESKLADRLRFVHGDVLATPLPQARFQLVTCMMGTFAHFPVPDRLPALAIMRRVLVPGGLVVLSNWNPMWLDARTLSLYSNQDSRILVNASPSPADMVAMLTQAGLTDVRVRHVAPFTDEQIAHWLAERADSPRRIQDYVLRSDMSLAGQLYLTTGRR